MGVVFGILLMILFGVFLLAALDPIEDWDDDDGHGY
jgi:hypothetical protein